MSRMVPYEETLSIEFKSENWLNGVGAKMFTIAGPVIVYGVTASVIYGVILMLLQSFRTILPSSQSAKWAFFCMSIVTHKAK